MQYLYRPEQEKNIEISTKVNAMIKTHSGLVTTYGDMHPDENYLRQWLVACLY